MSENNGLALHSRSPEIFHVDMCSGSGMLGLGLKLALGGRLRTVAHVEREARSAALIVERMEESHLDSAPVWDDVATCRNPEFVEYVRRFSPLFVTAGYPCQPFSYAGRRAGENDERHLWPHILQFVRLVRPWYLFLENVQGHLTLGFETVVTDLREAGYDIAAGLFTAAEVGASHERKRLFVLAVLDDTENGYEKLPDNRRKKGKGHQSPHVVSFGEPGEILADPDDQGIRQRQQQQESMEETLLADSCGTRLPGAKRTGSPQKWNRAKAHGPASELRRLLFAPGPDQIGLWKEILTADPTLEPTIRGVADGLAPGIYGDRLHIIGNGVVPLAVSYAFTLLAAAHVARRNDAD